MSIFGAAFNAYRLLKDIFRQQIQKELPQFAEPVPDQRKRDENMELDILDKKIRRLVSKLRTYNVELEIFDASDITLGPVLGKGGEGIVHKCTVIYNDIPVDAAAKVLQDNSDDAVSITLDEIELLCLAKDPIVNTTLRVFGMAALPDEDDEELGHLVMIMEAGIMNLLQLYQEQQVALHVTYDLWGRIAAAVHMLHTKKIIHQDLKPDNIIVTGLMRDIRGEIEKIEFKIIDMGMSTRLYTEKVVTDDILGTNGYHPPEVLYEESYDFSADIFMLGVTFCVMLHSPAFLKGELPALLKKLHQAKCKKVVGKTLYETHLEPTIAESQNLVPAIKTMLCKMLEKPSKRKVTLVDVVETCRDEAEATREQLRRQPQMLSPCQNGRKSDSGFGSEDSPCLSDVTSSREPPLRRMRLRRRRSPTPVSSEDTKRSLRKRKCSTSSDNSSVLQPVKRTRRHNAGW